MKFNGLCLVSVLLVISLNVVSGHECLDFKPMEDFEMENFYGRWYATKTMLPFTRCVRYDFYPQKVKKFNTNYQFYYGALEVKSLPSEMNVVDTRQDYSNPKAQKPYFIVLDTDYVSYASVFMCVKLPDDEGFLHFVTILYRSVVLDSEFLNELIVNILSVARAPLNLIHVDHKNCNYGTLVEDGDDQNVIDDDDDRRPYFSIEWMIQPTP